MCNAIRAVLFFALRMTFREKVVVKKCRPFLFRSCEPWRGSYDSTRDTSLQVIHSHPNYLRTHDAAYGGSLSSTGLRRTWIFAPVSSPPLGSSPEGVERSAT